MVGGRGTLVGPVLANPGKTLLTGALSQHWLVALRALIILVTLLLPGGITRLLRLRPRHEPAPVTPEVTPEPVDRAATRCSRSTVSRSASTASGR